MSAQNAGVQEVIQDDGVQEVIEKQISDALGLERGQDYELAAVLEKGECCVALELSSCAGRALVQDVSELLRMSQGAQLGGKAVSLVRVTTSIPIAGIDTRDLRRRYMVRAVLHERCPLKIYLTCSHVRIACAPSLQDEIARDSSFGRMT